MSRQRVLLSLLLMFPSVGCGGAGPNNDGGREIVRTGNPYERGLTDDDFPRVQELAENVYSYEQLRSAGDERFATVSLFVVTSEGVLVADGQGNVDETALLLRTVGEITDQPITHVVIGSDHGDHTGGNAVFPPSTVFLAHPTSYATMEASATDLNRGVGSPRVVVPTKLVDERTVLQLGATEIHVLFLGRAHTGGDLMVYLPEEKILFMSEAYLNRIFPAMRSAYPSEWVAMIERAQAMDVDIYVPGHGFVDSPQILTEELETFRRALLTVIAEAKRLHAAGVDVEEAREQAQFGDLEDWTIRSSQGPRAIQQVYMELNGELP